MSRSSLPRRPRRTALAIAVATGTLGGSLIGAGALGFDGTAASAAGACPQGTVLYRAVQPQQGTPDQDAVPTAGVVPAADQTDPFPGPVLAPESYLCVVPGVGAGPGLVPTTPVTAPAPSTPSPTPVPSDPPVLPEPDGLPPGLMPDGGTSGAPPVPSTDKPIGDRGPNDGGERPDAPSPDEPNTSGGKITRAEVLGRAVSWVLQQVPYSQTSWWTDSNGTYRQDCSGYVAMAWNLNQRINYWTGNLASVSHRIASSALQPGDILLLPRSHVVLFAGWADAAKTRFHLYEEYSRGKPARYVTGASLSYYLNRGYGAYRYDKIADVKRGRPGPQSTVYELASFSRPLSAPRTDPQLDAVDWTEAVAEEHEPEIDVPAPREDQLTPDPVPALPVHTLVDAQRTTDQRALAASEAATGGTGMVLIAAGLGLLFLGFPLSVAARAGVWTPAHSRRPEVQP